MLFAAWAVLRYRLWGIPLAVILSVAFFSLIGDAFEQAREPSLVQGIGVLIALFISLVLLGGVALQVGSIALIVSEAVKHEHKGNRSLGWLVQAGEIAAVAAIAVALYQVDYVWPTRRNAEYDAEVEVRRAQWQQEKAQDKAAKQQVVDAFAAAVAAGEEEAIQAAWERLWALQNSLGEPYEKELAHTFDRNTRAELLERSLDPKNRRWDFLWFSQEVLKADPDPELRMRMLLHLIELDELRADGDDRPYLDHHTREAVSLFEPVLTNPAPENAHTRLRVVESLGREEESAELFLPRLSQLAQSDPDANVRAAAAASIQQIQHGIVHERSITPYLGPGTRWKP